MDFSDALRAAKDGKRVRRALWADRAERLGGAWNLEVEFVQPPPLQDGRQFMPQLVVEGEDGILRPFSGANWDLLADDWEISRALRWPPPARRLQG